MGRKRSASCGAESKAVDLENAQCAHAELRMGAGELNLTGGAEALMEADFTYNVADGKPEVNYDIERRRRRAYREAGKRRGVRFGGDARNEWDLRLNDGVPLDLNDAVGRRRE